MSKFPPEYHAWKNAQYRCLNPKHQQFKNYGARGITVCDRWLKSYANFIADMGPRPTPQHSLERDDNDKGYEPSNCRWATKADQARNRRRSENHCMRFRHGSWQAHIGHNYKYIHLGTFPSREAAMAARATAERALWQ